MAQEDSQLPQTPKPHVFIRALPTRWSLLFPLLIYAIGILFFSGWSYLKDRNEILMGIDKRLIQAAQTVKYILPPDFHDRADSLDSISKIEDTNNISALTRYAQSVDVSYLGTITPQGPKLAFSSRSTTEPDMAANLVTYYGEPFEHPHIRKETISLSGQAPLFFETTRGREPLRNVLINEVSPTGNPYGSFASIDIAYVNDMLLKQIPLSIFQGFFFLLLAIPLILAFDRLQTRHRAELEKALIEAEKAQLEMLRYQLNPHFLFNTLNSINFLIKDKPDLAKTMIHKLADFCRASLFWRGERVSTLRQEMELIRDYLEIEKVRWGEYLQPEVEIPAELDQLPLPPFLFQPLVENAIKYGQLSEVDPLRIKVVAFRRDQRVFLQVANTGHWFEADPATSAAATGNSGPPSKNRGTGVQSTGVGLENLRKRLAQHFGEHFSLDKQMKDGWVIMEITIPDTHRERSPS